MESSPLGLDFLYKQAPADMIIEMSMDLNNLTHNASKYIYGTDSINCYRSRLHSQCCILDIVDENGD